jgi:hypothetical protein
LYKGVINKETQVPAIVTRQNYSSLGEDASVVEICYANAPRYPISDYSNPGALVAKYDGEFDTFNDPRDAVTAAIKIATQWKADGGENITIRHGFTGGDTMPFDAPNNADDMGAAEATEWAEKVYEKLLKCAVCGDVIGKEKWYPVCCHNDDSFACCSERCAEKASESNEEDAVADAHGGDEE